MIIKKLELDNFRNYEHLEVSLDQGTNIFYGMNGQGKTNALEAIFLCCTTKSHRKSRDREMIRFGEDEAHLRLLLDKGGVNYRIDMQLSRLKKKTAAVNSQSVRKAADLLGIAKLVLFSPQDLNIIRNSPAERRRFMDMELSQTDRVYLSNLSLYNRVMEERNTLLGNLSSGSGDEGLLDVIDEQLSRYGAEIIKAREEFIGHIRNIIKPLHDSLTGSDEELRVEYMPDTGADSFPDLLKSNRLKDIKGEYTSRGPHRDDIRFLLNGVNLRNYGSQGQVRTASVALKLSEIELLKNRIHESPILLLDDVLSELDSSRQKYLLSSIGNIQTIITCTGLDEFIRNRFRLDRVFYVSEGKMRPYEDVEEDRNIQDPHNDADL